MICAVVSGSAGGAGFGVEAQPAASNTNNKRLVRAHALGWNIKLGLIVMGEGLVMMGKTDRNHNACIGFASATQWLR